MTNDDESTHPPHEGGFVVLPRLTPVEDGIVLHYGDHGVLFGNGNESEICSAFGFTHFERAMNPMPRVISIPIFGRSESMNYTSSVQVCLDGDRGWMYGANGAGFYDVCKRELPRILHEAEATSFEGYAGAAHIRLMSRQLREFGRVDITGKGEMNGHEMLWFVIRLK